jgi:hypothetical protein
MKMTINKALVLGKVVRERINDLKGLRTGAGSKRTTIFSNTNEVNEPTYDIKVLDKRILNLQSLAFTLEAAVKEVNNTVTVDVDDMFTEELFKPLD